MKKILTVLLMALCGCSTSVYYREIVGNTTQVGIAVPLTTSLSIDALSIVDGQKLTVREPSIIQHSFSKSMTNNYFGVVKVCETITSNITVAPTNRIDIK